MHMVVVVCAQRSRMYFMVLKDAQNHLRVLSMNSAIAGMVISARIGSIQKKRRRSPRSRFVFAPPNHRCGSLTTLIEVAHYKIEAVKSFALNDVTRSDSTERVVFLPRIVN